MNRHQLLLTLILIYYVIVATLFIRAVPMFEASDEAEHFIYVHQILEKGALPIIQSKNAMARQPDAILRWNNQSHHAPLYYLLSAVTISWTERTDLADYLITNGLIFIRDVTENNANKWLHPYSPPTSDTHIAVMILRVANMILGIGTLLLIYYAAKLVLDSDLWALATTFLAASIPTFIVVHSSVSNDPLTIFIYSSGILWTLRALKNQAITTYDTALISIILAGIALTKLTGVSLFGVVFAGLIWGAYRGYWRWADALRVMVITGVTTLALSGWWYWRNFTLYGDPLALAATDTIWGRETPLTLATFAEDALRIAKSLWMMVGYLHQPVFAPDWFYVIVLVLVIIGAVGIVRLGLTAKKRDSLWILLLAFALVTGLLLWGTRSVDISYGRLLLPAVIPITILLVQGWQTLLRRAAVVFILPFIAMTFYAPLIIIPAAYPTIEAVKNIPNGAIELDWETDGLVMEAIDFISTETLTTNDTLRVDLYFRGGHPDNPALLLTAIDTLRVARLAHQEIYPGMAAVNQLNPDTLYRLPIRLNLNTPEDIREQRLVNIIIKWVDVEDNTSIEFDTGDISLELTVTTFYDPRYEAETLTTPINAQFADIVQLKSATIPAEASAGEQLTLGFEWLPLHDLDENWTLTVQLLDEAGELITQTDGTPYWYPTGYWLPDMGFNDTRTLSLPEDLSEGVYTVHIGWYRETDIGFERLPITQGIERDNLLILPTQIIVK